MIGQGYSKDSYGDLHDEIRDLMPNVPGKKFQLKKDWRDLRDSDIAHQTKIQKLCIAGGIASIVAAYFFVKKAASVFSFSFYGITRCVRAGFFFHTTKKLFQHALYLSQNKRKNANQHIRKLIEICSKDADRISKTSPLHPYKIYFEEVTS
jgi:hypothetical protein